MAETKADVVEQGAVAHQQALVKRLLPQRRKQVKHVIPGGAHLMENVDKRLLKKAVFTWLRRTRFFDEFSLVMVKDPGARTTEEHKVEDFPNTGTQVVWDQAKFGKQELANRITEHLSSTKLVQLTVKPDGIYVKVPAGNSSIDPSDADWEPHLLITPRPKGEYSVY